MKCGRNTRACQVLGWLDTLWMGSGGEVAGRTGWPDGGHSMLGKGGQTFSGDKELLQDFNLENDIGFLFQKKQSSNHAQ